MKTRNEISDELLARYLSGKASAEEEAEVLAYMEGHDERVEDMMNMATGIELHRRQERGAKVKMRRYYWWSAAAAIVLVVGSVLWFNLGGNSVEMEVMPSYADCDTVVEGDTLVPMVNESRDITFGE